VPIALRIPDKVAGYYGTMDRRSSAALPVRAHPLTFGVILFLASDAMFFAALFAAYYALRSIDSPWPPSGVRLDVGGSTIGTAMLGASDFMLVLSSRALGRQRFRAARRSLLAAIALGVAFLVVAVNGWLHATFTIASHAYGSLFYTMTGIHALHVAVGIVLLSGLAIGVHRPAFTAANRAGAQAIGAYWHFVFVVWLFIWGSIYWIR